MKFTKMHGCGNDYVYINGFTEHIEDKVSFVKAVSDRHFGVGGDGAIFINPSEIADFEMEMYNADGTRAEMCGNGIRCVAKYVYDKGLTDKTSITIESFGKVKVIELTVENNEVTQVKVNMGKPILKANEIPVVSQKEPVVKEKIVVKDKEYEMTCVSMGNPHAVVFIDDVTNLEIEAVGPYFENHEAFPNRTNTEFVKVKDRNTVQMRVWERGTGETLACGTGCCATLVACVLNGLTDRKATIEVLGGKIQVEWDEESDCVFMTGPATIVFEGEFPWK
ncbi:MAG: diaminopimelate epimerase [Lachnospiraceae bacterium]|nr:diaminopimelate epimerase [Lachnospiraceae bacterium]